MEPAERIAWLRLALTPEVGPRTARTLLAACGLPEAIFVAGRASLARHVPEPLAALLAAPAPAAVAAAMRAAERWLQLDPSHSLLTLADDDYPPLLLATADPPPVLFAAGRRELLQRPALAIVGSRSATAQGAANAEAFARHLALAGLTIVSGLALGIDAAAHRGALKALDDGADASTIAVLGTGVDVVYPASNRALHEAIRRRGLLLSEFALGTPGIAHNFPRRNRIIGGLARGVLVVEAALRSGSLITARLAADGGREVFALPGSIHSPTARGCHRLIKDGAKLVESAQDVLDELRIEARVTERRAPRPAAHEALLAALGFDPVDLDTLVVRTGREAGSLTAELLELELAQDVERLPGNRYQRLR
ncbi:MAG: DNA-protecting protein DprA [Burkholderiales bacterium]|jgi:DNA processing protein|nr:DNA-protecting protein DprA [Burkholderiales bacterium]